MWQTIGFEKIKKQFSLLHKNQKLGHAYIFTGQDMIGKRTFALELFQKINSVKESAEQHPDLFYLKIGDGEDSSKKNKISIKEIRGLKRFLSLTPYIGPYKFAIIDSAHELTNEAGNSILKVLEEPPAGSILILISSQPEKMLPTVISRCEVVRFPPHSSKILKNHLEELNLNDKQVDFLIQFSNGRIGLAIDLYEQNSFSLIRNVIEDFQKFMKNPVYGRFEYISKLLGGKLPYSPETALLYWILYLRSPLSMKLEINKQKILKNLSELYYFIKQPQFNHRLIFENFAVNI